MGIGSDAHISRSEQKVLNQSFDTTFKVIAFEMLGYDGQSMVRQEADDMQVKVVEDSGYTYFCKAQVGTAEATAKWKVFRLDSTGNKVYADGDSNFDNTASDPTALSYSYS